MEEKLEKINSMRESINIKTVNFSGKKQKLVDNFETNDISADQVFS